MTAPEQQARPEGEVRPPQQASDSSQGHPDAGNGEARPDAYAEIRASLEAERKRREATQRELDKLRQQSMTEQEKAVAAARAEGYAEAERQAGARLAGAQFIAAATGRIADPAAALEWLDLARLTGEDGQPDPKAIAAAVERLAAATPAPPAPPQPGKIPPGPRQQPASRGDFIRDRLMSGRTR